MHLFFPSGGENGMEGLLCFAFVFPPQHGVAIITPVCPLIYSYFYVLRHCAQVSSVYFLDNLIWSG